MTTTLRAVFRWTMEIIFFSLAFYTVANAGTAKGLLGKEQPKPAQPGEPLSSAAPPPQKPNLDVMIAAAVTRVKNKITAESPGEELCLFAEQGNLPEVKARIEAGTDINSHDRMGRTPLMCAIETQQIEVVTYLLQQDKIDVNATDNNNDTVLDYAQNGANTKIEMAVKARQGDAP